VNRLILALALASSLPLLAGCEHKYEVDTARVENRITNTLQDRGFEFVTVSCPNDIKINVGDSFHCVVKDEGHDQQVLATVTLENDQGDITWSTDG
jgi:Domain of unknown function (DUF4333)